MCVPIILFQSNLTQFFKIIFFLVFFYLNSAKFGLKLNTGTGGYGFWLQDVVDLTQ